MHSSIEPSDAWLTPESRACLRALAERDGAPGRDDDDDPELRAAAGELAQLLCADVRARGGTAVDLVLALKEAWASVPRQDAAQRRRANERLSRIVTLCIDTYYAARQEDRGVGGGK